MKLTAEQVANLIMAKIKWAGGMAVDVIALAIILAAMAPAVGFPINYVKMLSWTELAYAMGAYWLFRSKF